jgi:uncharacterized membrane protein
MDRILAAVFPSAARAADGLRALEELDRQGTITAYATAVVAADEHARVRVTQAADPGPLGTSVALLTGSVLGPLAGSVGIAVAAGAGTLGRVLYDLARLGIEEDFLTELGEALRPGTAAVVAEVWEERVAPLDARIAALGGTVLRRVRKEIADGRVERDVAALRAELASLRTELASAPEEDRAHVEERIDAARTKLRGAQHQAKALLDALTSESEAKIACLEARAGNASGERRERLEARIAELRSRFLRRGEKVCDAWVVARRALA